MDEPFELPVIYKGEELMFPAELLNFGYTHKFKVDVFGNDIMFEPDEERNYRAILNIDDDANDKIDIELLKAIALSIENIIK